MTTHVRCAVQLVKDIQLLTRPPIFGKNREIFEKARLTVSNCNMEPPVSQNADDVLGKRAKKLNLLFEKYMQRIIQSLR